MHMREVVEQALRANDGAPVEELTEAVVNAIVRWGVYRSGATAYPIVEQIVREVYAARIEELIPSCSSDYAAGLFAAQRIVMGEES